MSLRLPCDAPSSPSQVLFASILRSLFLTPDRYVNSTNNKTKSAIPSCVKLCEVRWSSVVSREKFVQMRCNVVEGRILCESANCSNVE
jgi:hypothetical protein